MLEEYGKNKKLEIAGQYIYDETNKMVSGANESGEVSSYIYNGLGALVENQWIITKNGYGYHDVDAGDVETAYPATGLKNSSTVVKQFVVDYTSATFEPLMEHEVNGLDYRYVYGNDRLSVNITGVETSSGNLIENGDQIRLYYHMDYLGTTDYLTNPVSLKVTSWTHYNEWGEITHNAVLKTGQRELDLVKRFATHDYDAVLNMYYAKARMYDAENRRFAAMDPILDASQYSIKEYIENPLQLVQYVYCVDNPLRWVDPLGLKTEDIFDVIKNIEILESLAKSYLGGKASAKKEAALVLQLIRSSKYNYSLWDGIAGPIDYDFIRYVEKGNKEVHDYFLVFDCDFFVTGVHPDFEGGQLDLIHFAATAGGKLYDSGFKDGFKEGLMFEAYLNDLAGWAGDLQTLIRDDILPNTSEYATYDEIYEKTMNYLRNTDPNSSTFSYVDLISDIDGYNIAKEVGKNKSISAVMTDYYNFGYSNRYTKFSNGQSKGYLRVLAKVFTVPNFAVFFKWPLLSSLDSIPKNVTNGVADAFADYIWEMAQSERK